MHAVRLSSLVVLLLTPAEASTTSAWSAARVIPGKSLGLVLFCDCLSRTRISRSCCARAKIAAHSGALEASAVVLGLRRLGREARWHGHRGAFLVDAQAVLGALQKGRSSAGSLRFPVQQAGALSLACGWRWRWCYLPSESNPADAPSRGVVAHRTTRRPVSHYRSRAHESLCQPDSDSSAQAQSDCWRQRKRLRIGGLASACN